MESICLGVAPNGVFNTAYMLESVIQGAHDDMSFTWGGKMDSIYLVERRMSCKVLQANSASRSKNTKR